MKTLSKAECCKMYSHIRVVYGEDDIGKAKNSSPLFKK